MPYVRNGDVNIYYEVEDSGEPALVFVHGWTANMNFWKEQRKYFSGRYRMVFVDNRGHGKSDKPREYRNYRFDNFISDLNSVVEDGGLDKFILVGHSFGTMISMQYCVDFPDKVLALILIGGGTRIQTFHRIGYPVANFFASIAYRTSSKYVAKLAFGKNAGKLRKWGWEQAMKYTPRHSAMNTYRTLTTIDLRGVAGKIEKPTLIIVGDEDALLPVSKSRELNSLIRDSNLVVVPDAGHCVMLESPDMVNKAMDEFITGLS